MTETSKKNVYDKTSQFKEQCNHLLDELTLLCSIHRIPFFWTAAVKNTEHETEYISNAVGPASRGIELADDKISKHLGVAAGLDIETDDDEFSFSLE